MNDDNKNMEYCTFLFEIHNNYTTIVNGQMHQMIHV